MSVDHYENFPVASWLCPPPLRPAVAAIYWFARTADDIADEGTASAESRLADLAAYRRCLHTCTAGPVDEARWHRVFGPLAAAIERHRLPLSLLDALLDAFVQDVHNPVYTRRAELLDYCRRSANPVGRLLLHLYGVDDERALAQSDAVCTALQLINFWQDLSVDLPRGRCYLPEDDCQHHHVTPAMLDARQDTEATRALVRDLCRWAHETMHHGAPLVHRLPGRAGWELRLVVQGGLRILERIARMDHATLNQRPTLTARDVPSIAWRAIGMRATEHPAETAA